MAYSPLIKRTMGSGMICFLRISGSAAGGYKVTGGRFFVDTAVVSEAESTWDLSLFSSDVVGDAGFAMSEGGARAPYPAGHDIVI